MAVVREFAWGEADYREFRRQRQAHLREPLGLDLRDENLDAERSHWHFGLYELDTLIGGAIIVQRGNRVAQLRQMLVLPEYRGRGYGRLIVRHVEYAARARSVDVLYMLARRDAVEFYERCGYLRVGPEFEHLTIPHQRMEKVL